MLYLYLMCDLFSSLVYKSHSLPPLPSISPSSPMSIRRFAQSSFPFSHSSSTLPLDSSFNQALSCVPSLSNNHDLVLIFSIVHTLILSLPHSLNLPGTSAWPVPIRFWQTRPCSLTDPPLLLEVTAVTTKVKVIGRTRV